MSVTVRAPQDFDTSFMAGGGELGQLMRDHDWAATPLGPPGAWPRSLKTVVRIMLTSRQPIAVNADMRRYLHDQLAPRYRVEVVADGEQALAAVRRPST